MAELTGLVEIKGDVVSGLLLIGWLQWKWGWRNGWGQYTLRTAQSMVALVWSDFLWVWTGVFGRSISWENQHHNAVYV